MKLNCWEVKKCGRYPGGDNTDELGICPAATEHKLHGVNNGVNGGRICWTIKETLCGSSIQGSFSQKLTTCLSCDFYTLVRDEEGDGFKSSKTVFAMLN